MNKNRELRKENGLTILELAEQTGLSSTQIGSFEREEKEPSLITIVTLADFFNVSIDYLVGRTEKIEAGDEVNIEKMMLLKKQVISEGNAVVYHAIENFERYGNIATVFKALYDQTKLANGVLSVLYLMPKPNENFSGGNMNGMDS